MDKIKKRSYNRKIMKKKRNAKLRRLVILFAVISIIIFMGIKVTNRTSNNSKVEDNRNKVIIKNDQQEINTTVAINTNNSSNNNDIEDDNIVNEDIVNNKEDSNLKYLTLLEDINATDAREVQDMITNWNYKREDGKKIAYLTFDDGPSEYVTNEILDILNQKNVKATFFILGSMVDQNDYAKEALKRIVNDGHAVGNHGYCHRYDMLYPNGVVNTDIFMDDIKKTENIMKEVIGEDFNTNVIRFPGGHSSWNTTSIDSILNEQGYSYIDWNTLNGDAEGNYLEAEGLVSRLEETILNLYGNDDVIIILMHDTDTKQETAKSLAATIDYIRGLGYEFKTLK